MFCTNCGKKIVSHENFCSDCGTKTQQVVTPTIDMNQIQQQFIEEEVEEYDPRNYVAGTYVDRQTTWWLHRTLSIIQIFVISCYLIQVSWWLFWISLVGLSLIVYSSYKATEIVSALLLIGWIVLGFIFGSFMSIGAGFFAALIAGVIGFIINMLGGVFLYSFFKK